MTDEVGSTLGIAVLMDGIALGEIFEPEFPGATGEEKDTTAQNNIGGVATALVGLIKHDNFKFKVRYNGSTTQETLAQEIYDRENHTWTFVMPPTFHAGGHSFVMQGQINGSKRVLEGNGPGHIEISTIVNAEPTPITTWATGLTTPFFTIVDENSNALTPSPAASGSVYEYQVQAYADNTSIKITPTATTGTIRVNDTVVATGVQSGTITLNTGTGAVTMVSITVSENSKTAKIYWIRVYLGDTNHP